MARTENSRPVPFSEQEALNILLARASFWHFLTTIYPLSFEGETFDLPSAQPGPFALSDLHYEWARAAQAYSRVCIMAPRLHLKSTVLGKGYAFWKMFTAHQHCDVAYFSYNEDLARVHVADLKRRIQRNPYCRFWRDRKPAGESIISFDVSFGDGESWLAQVDPIGVFSNARGRHPQVVICDDLLSEFANPLEASELRRINDIFYSVILSLPEPQNPLVVVGTPQSYDDIIYSLREDPSFFWKAYPAIKNEETQETAWPEKFPWERLMEIKRSVRDRAFQVEYMLLPVVLSDAFLHPDVVKACVSETAKRWSLDEPFDNTENIPIYGGMDVGKEVHPSHISILAKHPETGDLIQIYETWLDHLPYNQQAVIVNKIIERFGVWKFYYDSTRAELDDRYLSKRAIGKKFKKNIKGHMALLLEKRLTAEPGEPGIVLLGPEDSRQVRQLSAVKRDLSAYESQDGHGDSFWSNALAVWAAEQGPTFVDLGDAGELFGRR
jgi:hypothetical protein